MGRLRITELEAAGKFEEAVTDAVSRRWPSIKEVVGSDIRLQDSRRRFWVRAEFGCAIAALQMPTLSKLFPPDHVKILRYSAVAYLTERNKELYEGYDQYAAVVASAHDTEAALDSIAAVGARRLRLTRVVQATAKGERSAELNAIRELLNVPNFWEQIVQQCEIALDSLEEPPDGAYRMLKGRLISTLASAAPTALERMEQESALDAVATRRALGLWPSVERRMRCGMSFHEALFDLASDLYPPETEFLESTR